MPIKGSSLLAIPLFLGCFAASYMALSHDSGPRYDSVLQAVRDDPGNLVCTGGVPCLGTAAEYDLVVFFSRRDCAIGLYHTAVLDELYRAAPRARLNVVGVAYDLDAAGARRLARVSGITYPLYVAPDRLERRFGRMRAEGANRPLAVLMDRSGSVVHTVVTGGSIQELRGQTAVIAAHVGGTAP